MHTIYDREKLHQAIAELDGSLSLQVALVLRSLTMTNVEEVLGRLPGPFKKDFDQWVRHYYSYLLETYFEEIPTVSIGEPLAKESILALRAWMLQGVSHG